MLTLAKNPTMKDYQQYVRQLVEERGFADETAEDMFVLLVEEIGETARSILRGLREPVSVQEEIPHEISDSFTYLVDIANQFNINIEQSLISRKYSDHHILQPGCTLPDLQRYLAVLEVERGLSDKGTLELLALLFIDISNLGSAIRKEFGIKVDPNVPFKAIGDEVCNSLVSLLTLANRFQINAEQAFRRKEEINKHRTWIRVSCYGLN
jgi:NTP pyrophosphatase (non-canonical NTP hydrolase)